MTTVFDVCLPLNIFQIFLPKVSIWHKINHFGAPKPSKAVYTKRVYFRDRNRKTVSCNTKRVYFRDRNKKNSKLLITDNFFSWHLMVMKLCIAKTEVEIFVTVIVSMVPV